MYATAKDQEAEVVTRDADLKDLSWVVYVKRVSIAMLCFGPSQRVLCIHGRDYGGNHQAVRNPAREGRRGTSAA